MYRINIYILDVYMYIMYIYILDVYIYIYWIYTVVYNTYLYIYITSYNVLLSFGRIMRSSLKQAAIVSGQL
jgi:hypothetical protein